MSEAPHIPGTITVQLGHGFMAQSEDSTENGVAVFRDALHRFLNVSGSWMIYRRYPRGKGAVWSSAWVIPKALPSEEDA